MDARIVKAVRGKETPASEALFKLVEEVCAARQGRVKRASPTPASLSKILQCFTDDKTPPLTRRWAGVLLLSFTQDFENVKNRILQLQSKDPRLGPLVFHASEEIRLISTAIITSITESEDDLPSFWPAESQCDLSNFPLVLKDDSTWAEEFAAFHEQTSSRQPRDSDQFQPTTFYARLIDIDDDELIVPPNLPVVCIVQNEVISATTSPPSANYPLFLDIAFNHIEDIRVSAHVVKSQGSQENIPQLKLTLKDTLENISINTKRKHAKVVRICCYTIQEAEAAASIVFAAQEESLQLRSELSQTFVNHVTPKAVGLSASSDPSIAPDIIPMAPREAVSRTAQLAETVLTSGNAVQDNIGTGEQTKELMLKDLKSKKGGALDLRNLASAVAGPAVMALRARQMAKLQPKLRTPEVETLSTEVNEAVNLPIALVTDPPLPDPARSIITTTRATKVTTREPRKSGHGPGSLVGLLSALSPEPEEPNTSTPLAASSHPAQPNNNEARAHKTTGTKASEASRRSNLQLQISRPVPQQLSKRAAGQGGHQDTYELLNSEASADETKKSSGRPKGKGKQLRNAKGKKSKVKPDPKPTGKSKDDKIDHVARVLESSLKSTRTTRSKAAITQGDQSKPSAPVKPVGQNLKRTPATAHDNIEQPSAEVHTQANCDNDKSSPPKAPSSHDETAPAGESLIEFEAAVINYDFVTVPKTLTAGRLNQAKSFNNQPGGSSQNPIELSPDRESSDDEDEAQPNKENRITVTATTHQRKPLTEDGSFGNTMPSKSASHSAIQKSFTPAQVSFTPAQKSFISAQEAPIPAQTSSTPTPGALVDERSARKANLVSFAKSGPRNQGRISVLRQSFAAPDVFVSPDLQSSLHNLKQKLPQSRVAFQETQPTQKLPTWQSQTTQQMPAKRPSGSQLPALTLKRQKLSSETYADQDFIPLEDIEMNNPDLLAADLGRQASQRSASQRSVRITADGSPIPQGDHDIDIVVDSSRAESDTALAQPILQRQNAWDELSRATSRHDPHLAKRRLSSNSKPKPLSPLVDSQAISGYAPERMMHDLDARTLRKTKDPFSSSGSSNKQEPSFLAHLSMKMGQPQLAEHEGIARHGRPYGTATVDHHDAYLSDASTQETFHDEEIEPARSRKDEMEWEAALQPRHRNLLDVLHRTSRRLINHIVDSESAVSDVIDGFAQDAAFIIGELHAKHRKQLKTRTKSAREGTKSIRQRYMNIEKALKQSQSLLKGQVRVDLLAWKQVHDTAVLQIKQLEGIGS